MKESRPLPRRKRRRFTVFLIAASLWSAGCSLHGAANSPCRERCRYDYQFCNDESPANSAHFTFSLAPEADDDKSMPDPTVDHCARKYDTCMSLCGSMESGGEKR